MEVGKISPQGGRADTRFNLHRETVVELVHRLPMHEGKYIICIFRVVKLPVFR